MQLLRVPPLILWVPYTITIHIQYLFDWDANGSVDQVLPATGDVAQGVAQNVAHVWGTPGAKQFKVMAEDAAGKKSGWTTHAVRGCDDPPILPGDPTGGASVTPGQLLPPTTVTPNPDPTPVDPATLWTYPPGQGPVGIIEASMKPRITNTKCTLSWTTQNVTQCQVYQQEQLVESVFVRGELQVEPGTYTVRCRQLRDDQIIRSQPQACIWNPAVREI